MSKYMEQAIALAQKGRGYVNPNPMVGAVIVQDGEIIAQGYHQRYRQNHAEIEALNQAAARRCSVDGATMYVTLEPCSHYGNTPPCAKAIVESGIKKVVVAMEDPNRLVAGRGLKYLRENEIEVEVGDLKERAEELNEIFIKYITTGRPFCAIKTAMTLDGKTAAYTGQSKWITGQAARCYVHWLRHSMSAVMVGVNTVIQDDPELTVRLDHWSKKDFYESRQNVLDRCCCCGSTDKAQNKQVNNSQILDSLIQAGQPSNPMRIVVDSTGRIPLQSKILGKGTILACTEKISTERKLLIQQTGAEVLEVAQKDNRVCLNSLMMELGKRKIDSVLLEGGGTLNYSALEQNVVDKVIAFVAPKIIGGGGKYSPVSGLGREHMDQAWNLSGIKLSSIDKDLIIEGKIEQMGQECY